MSDPGKGSNRRPGDNEAFSRNYSKIFGEKPVSSGRKVYRQTKNGFVELENPPPPLPSDLRFEGTFVSPVDGSVISNKYDLLRHNAKHRVQQILPGMDQDIESRRKEIHDECFGKKAREQRIKDVIRAVENPVIKRRDTDAEIT